MSDPDLVYLFPLHIFALLVVLVVGCILSKEKIGKLMKYILPGILILAVVFVGIDKINDFHYLSRWKEDTPKTKLERMITSKDGVELCYDGKEYLITLEDKKAKIYDKKAEKQTSKGRPFCENGNSRV